MTNESQFLAVGHIKDAQGIKGEVYVRLFAGQADWAEKLTSVRLKSRDTGAVQNFNIVKIRPHKEGLVIALSGVVDRNRAEELKGLTFEIPQTYLESEPGEDIYLHEVLGFKVIDSKLGALGSVKEFSSNGLQDLLVVEYSGREVLVPFVEDFIEKIDYETRVIDMNLPEGLCDSM